MRETLRPGALAVSAEILCTFRALAVTIGVTHNKEEVVTMKPIGVGGIGLRFVFALTLVLCTYNPSGYSYFHWLKNTLPAFTPLLAVAGLALIIGWVIYLRATLRALGLFGLILAALFFAAVVWLLIDQGWLSLESFTVASWVIIVLLSAVLSVGMSWSLIQQRWSGQVSTDDVDKNE
jgi:hypothetical protein